MSVVKNHIKTLALASAVVMLAAGCTVPSLGKKTTTGTTPTATAPTDITASVTGRLTKTQLEYDTLTLTNTGKLDEVVAVIEAANVVTQNGIQQSPTPVELIDPTTGKPNPINIAPVYFLVAVPAGETVVLELFPLDQSDITHNGGVVNVYENGADITHAKGNNLDIPNVNHLD